MTIMYNNVKVETYYEDSLFLYTVTIRCNFCEVVNIIAFIVYFNASFHKTPSYFLSNNGFT